MDADKIKQTVDATFDSAFAKWSNQIEKDLYPAAFANQYSWLRVKSAIRTNNLFLKEALKLALTELLSE